MHREIRLLDQNDLDAFDDFLRPKTAEAYFIRSNAKRAGLDYEGHPFQAQYLASFNAAKITGVISYTWMNAIIVYADDPETVSGLSQAAVPLIKKRNGAICACLGLAEQVASVIAALDIPKNNFCRDEAEILYSLDIKSMMSPDLLKSPDYFVRRAKETDFLELTSWLLSYNLEILNATPGPELEQKVRNDVIQRIGLGELFVLEMRGRILSLCGAGGGLLEAIMIAPLWTPHEFRKRGYGKAVTAGTIQLLAKMYPALHQAVLYTANPVAAHVYEQIGFKKCANWRLALLKEHFYLEL
jgi:hypothetical protein